jgi:DNA-binding beta-propeller fold protein YncE
MHRKISWFAALVVAACNTSTPVSEDGSFRTDLGEEVQDSQFWTFETEQVRPLAMTADGKRLFAVNTPDGKLEVYNIKNWGLQHAASVSVGMEPTSVAVEGSQAWVVNHLSDSISIVDIGNGANRYSVTRTLLVGDEPRDVVFAGTAMHRRAFVTTAHRGQNVPYDPQLTTPSVGRADVWVFDVGNLGATMTGTPLSILSLYTDTPRALAVTPDGSKVYAAGFHTGNNTTTVSTGTTSFVGLPPPTTNFEGVEDPSPFGILGKNGLIVKWDGAHWLDEIGRNFDAAINFTLADKDLFEISATSNPPAVTAEYKSVGTVIFNLAVHPTSGKVYATNTEARNDVRFEGPGIFVGHPGVRGHLHESRVTVIDPAAASVTPRHLNKHIDYGTCCGPVGSEESENSLAFPTQAVFSSDGSTLYVAAFGSSKVGVFATSEINANTFVPDAADHIELSGGGPSGLVLDEPRGRMYVMTRFDNSIKVVDLDDQEETSAVSLYNPEPQSVVAGRPFLYDARFSSSHGDSACASCHVFGNFDSLAWDLGNPDNSVVPNPGPLNNPVPPIPGLETFADFNPLKGPMTTQSLRGMANHGPMHWRGDRTGGFDEPSAQPDDGTFDENAAFNAFNVAFVGLLGRDEQIEPEDMQSFTDFILQVSYPPNPIRNLDDSLTADQQAGSDFYFGPKSLLNANHSCNDCHKIDPTANPETFRPGLFGSDAMRGFTFQNQLFKSAHMRNAYQKVGMFGFPENPFFFNTDNDFKGEQVRGFGFSHDGSVDRLVRFIRVFPFAFDPVGNPTGFPPGDEGDAIRLQVEQFMLAFPTNLKPIVGQQVTYHNNAAAVAARVSLLKTRASAGDCDLTAKMVIAGVESSWLYDGAGGYDGSVADVHLSSAALVLLATILDRPLTYTAVPPGTGVRVALDRDVDGVYDGDELLAGTDPADPSDN